MNYIFRSVGLLFFLLLTLSASSRDLRNGKYAEKYGWTEGDSTITVPASVRRIPPFAFAGIEGLKHIMFESGSECKVIAAYAFAECLDLEDVELPEGLTTFEDGVFRECRNLKYLKIPQSVWFIPNELFLRCVSLEKVDIPERLLEIRSSAFAGCRKLQEFNFPPRLKEIGNNAFSGCKSLEEISLPPTVTSLESYAFSDCSNLRKATLSSAYNMIGELIFSGCDNLTILIVPATKPPRFECESFIFEPDNEEAYTRCTLYVPDNSIDYYEFHHGWNLFQNIKPLSTLE